MKNANVTTKHTVQRWFRLAALIGATLGCAAACSHEAERGETIGETSLALITLTGTVTDRGGNPVPDVEVTLYDSLGDKTGAGISGSDGSYVIVPSGVDIPDGTYDVVVTPPGGSVYVVQTFDDQPFLGTSTFDIVLVSGVSVTGRLVDSGGSAMGSYSVCLDSLCTVTAADGAFSFSVGNGSRRFYVNGSESLPGGYRYIWVQKLTPVVVGDVGVDMGDVTLETRRLTGLVRDAATNPVAGATVGATNSAFSASFGDFSGYWYGYTTTESDGTFSIPVLLGGPGFITASAPGYPSAAISVTIADDTDVTIDLVGNVTGRIVDDSGTALSGQSVCFYGSGGSACVQNESDGTYALALPNGTYSFSTNGYLDPTFRTYVYLSKSTSIVVSGATALGDTVIQTRTLSGLVRDSALSPVSGAAVGAINYSVQGSFGDLSGYWYGSTTTGTDGRFTLTTLPSSGLISANASGHPTAIASVAISSDLDVTLDLVAKLTGRVVDSFGAGVPDRTHCFYQSSGGGCVQGASDGTFQLNIPDGSYQSYISGSVNLPTGWQYSSFSRSSSIVVSGTTALGNLTLQTRIVAGRVVDVDGFPVSDVSVGSPNQAFYGSFADYSGYWYGQVQTGADGRFVLPAFPGTGTLVFTPSASSGLTTFGLDNFQITNDRMLGVSVQFLRDVASAFVVAGGTLTTDDGGNGASPTDPVDTWVKISIDGGAGTVIIEEMPLEGDPPLGYRYLTQQINVTAPGSSDPNDPILITFRIDCSRFAPASCDQATANSVILFRNDVALGECANPGDRQADPDPCVDDRSIIGDDVSITVATTAASIWTFALKLDDDADGDRIVDADDACPNEAEDIDGNDDTDGCPELDDADGDGIDDGVDLCPGQAEDIDGNDDADGCPEVEDTDGDGLDDSVDSCPNEPEDLDGNQDADGCPEADDADGDGVADATDACPNEAEDIDGNDDTDGCPEVEDSDGDGIPDPSDACPSEAEDLDGNADTDGCPETEPPPVKCADVTGDGRVTYRDIREIRQRLGARQGSRRYRSKYDLNGDGRISRADVAIAHDQLGDRCRQ